MIPGMIADRMPSLCDPPHKVWVLLCGLADHEEGRVCLMPFQNVKKARCEFGMWPVVKGESGDGVLCRDVGNGARHSPRDGTERSVYRPDATTHPHASNGIRASRFTLNAQHQKHQSLFDGLLMLDSLYR